MNIFKDKKIIFIQFIFSNIATFLSLSSYKNISIFFSLYLGGSLILKLKRIYMRIVLTSNSAF
jgi:hypothetical protein